MTIKKYLPLLFILLSFTAKANYMLVQNVTKLGNNPTNKTIQIQFDLSWQNSWRDSINWDAAWIFIKFKDANGLWQHARLNLAGYLNGAGTTNIIKVASDSVGAFVYRSALGTGNFNATSMQLQWNYGASGLTDVSTLEVRVFATEMVYVPEGDFNCAGPTNSDTLSNTGSFYVFNNPNVSSRYGAFTAPGNNFPVINSRLSPTLTYSDSAIASNPLQFNNIRNIRIKGDVGIDMNNDGIIDNTTFPTGYKAFYCYKYEMSEQQYADYLNTLTTSQISTLGLAGTNIALNNGQYFSSSPNLACGNSNFVRLSSYSDWSGLRMMTFLEFNKASFGPIQPVYNTTLRGYPAWGSNSYPSDWNINRNTIQNVGYNSGLNIGRVESGSSYYGIMNLTGNTREPIIRLTEFSFSPLNGNGKLNTDGTSDIPLGSNSFKFIDYTVGLGSTSSFFGFRYVRSAE